MALMSTKILITENLETVLAKHNIKPEDYSPAYSGESVGLDLYNAGPAVEILPTVINSRTPPISKIPNTKTYKTLIPTGLQILLERNWVALIQERGSVIKTPLKVRAGVIDPGWTNEIFVNCINVSSVPYVIPSGHKLPFQLIVIPADTTFESIPKEDYDLQAKNALRKHNALGSSDSHKGN